MIDICITLLEYFNQTTDIYRNYGSTITFQVLTSKLSGLDLNEGRARGGDSGVVSAMIH